MNFLKNIGGAIKDKTINSVDRSINLALGSAKGIKDASGCLVHGDLKGTLNAGKHMVTNPCRLC